MIKNPKALRTHAILGSRDQSGIKARRRVFLTGTPVLNRPAELWTLVYALDPNGLGRSWRGYHDRYCGPTRGYQGRVDYSGASHLDELQAKLRGTIMVRRLKVDVLKELPPKRRQVIVLKPESRAELEAIAREAEFTKKQDADMAAARAELARLSDDQASEAYKNAVRRLRQVEGVAFTETSAVRKAVAVAKVPRVVEHIRDFLDETGQKLVVMAHHHEVIDGITHELLRDVVVAKADGRDSNEKRQAEVDAFQNDPRVRVIVCSMQAMGVGHTLHAASTVIFAELDWVPGIVSQAEDRCHRIGQYDSVLAQHILLDGSLDCRMASLVVEKQEIMDRALDRATDALPEVSRLAAPQIPATPAKRTTDAPRTSGNGSSGEAILTEAQILAVLDALRQLAGRCDGAYQLDGMGFNKLDSRFGKELASRAMLTQRQAQAGRTLCIKYQRQLSPLLVAIIKG
jgi:SWI/SNF-related matrix-associated actin-dependent regulator 1 of chromatin subfamily A